MGKFSTALLLILFFAGTVLAHGGGHEHAPAAQEPVIESSTPVEEPVTYGMDMGEENTGGGTYGIEPDDGMADHSGHESMASSPEPGLFDDPLAGLELSAAPATSQHEDEHSGHSIPSHEQHVEPTSFEKVPSDASGRGIAIGLTVLSGLTFGLLSLIRPFER